MRCPAHTHNFPAGASTTVCRRPQPSERTPCRARGEGLYSSRRKSMGASPPRAVKANCIRRRSPLYWCVLYDRSSPRPHKPSPPEDRDRGRPNQATPSQPRGTAKPANQGGKNSPRPQRSRPEPRAQDQGVAMWDSTWEPRVGPRADRGQSMLVCMLLPVKNQQNRESCFCVGPRQPRRAPSQASPGTFASWFS